MCHHNNENESGSEQVVAENNICNECSKHMHDVWGYEIDSENESDRKEEKLTKEQMRNVVEALSSTTPFRGNELNKTLWRNFKQKKRVSEMF